MIEICDFHGGSYTNTMIQMKKVLKPYNVTAIEKSVH